MASYDEQLAEKAAMADKLLASFINSNNNSNNGESPNQNIHNNNNEKGFFANNVPKDQSRSPWGQQEQQHFDDDDERFVPKKLFYNEQETRVPRQQNIVQNESRHRRTWRTNESAFVDENCCVRIIGVPVHRYLGELLDLFSQYGDIVKYLEVGDNALHVQFSTRRAAQAAVTDSASRNMIIGGHEITAHLIPKLEYQDPERIGSYYNEQNEGSALGQSASMKRRKVSNRVYGPNYARRPTNTSAAPTSGFLPSLQHNIGSWLRDSTTSFNKFLIFTFGNDS